MPTTTIAAATGAVICAIALATVALLFGPDYLEQRRMASTPTCIGRVTFVDAQRYGCKLP